MLGAFKLIGIVQFNCHTMFQCVQMVITTVIALCSKMSEKISLLMFSIFLNCFKNSTLTASQPHLRLSRFESLNFQQNVVVNECVQQHSFALKQDLEMK